MSSRAIRDMTKCSPSRVSSTPAIQPSTVEPVSRRTSLHITRIISVPVNAEEKRHPSGFMPNIHSPTAIIHLPTSGCTTSLTPGAKIPLVEPELMILSASLPLASFPSLTKFAA